MTWKRPRCESSTTTVRSHRREPAGSPDVLTDFGNDLAYFFEVGGYVMPPLIAATIVLWFAIGYRYAALQRGSVRAPRRLLHRIADESFVRKPKGLLDEAVVI